MDTITHGIVGALIGKAFFADEVPIQSPAWYETPRSTGRVAVLGATVAAIFPDIDVFAGPLAHNSLAMMTWHRSVTHSLVMLPLWAAAVALFTLGVARSLCWPSPPFSTLLLACAVALGSHIFLDLITTFGTMIWSPLDYSRPAWDWVFIIDLTLTSAALVPQLAAWVFQRQEGAQGRAFAVWGAMTAIVVSIGPAVRRANVPYSTGTILFLAALYGMFLLLPLRRGAGARMGRVKWSRVGIALLAVYLAFAGGMHQNALAKMKQFASDSRIDGQNIAAMPMPPSPLRWAGIISIPTGDYVVQFDQLGTEPVQIQFFAEPAPNRYLADARSLHDVQTYLWFARFPVFRYFERGDQHVVQISDLRFYGIGRTVAEGPVRGPGANFMFQVIFANDGRVISSGRLPPNTQN